MNDTYKVIECATVTEDELETIINKWEGEGFHFQGIQFAMREASKRPAMAFVFFTQPKRKDKAS